MKTLFSLTILFCVITLPVNAQLKDADLNKIKLIVNEAVDKKISESEKRMKEYIDIRFNAVDQRFDGIDKRISQSNNITYGLIALIIFAIGLPAWQNRRDREDQKKIEALARKVEALEQERVANP